MYNLCIILTSGVISPSALHGSSIVVSGIASMSYGSNRSLGGPAVISTKISATASAEPIEFSATQIYLPVIMHV